MKKKPETKKVEIAHPKYHVKNLLVDLDGTLLGASNFFASIRFIRQALWILRKFGGWTFSLKILWAINQVLTTPIPHTPDIKRLTNSEKLKEVISKNLHLPITEAENFMKNMIGGVFPSLQPFFFPMPGAKEFLDWAKEKFPLILATNPVWNIDIIEMRVRWAGLDPAIFRSITHADRMTACKPHLHYYQEILAQENFQANESLLIGNDLKMDLPAVNAGIAVFIVTKKKGIRSLPVPKGAAPAWTGDFKALKELLS